MRDNVRQDAVKQLLHNYKRFVPTISTPCLQSCRWYFCQSQLVQSKGPRIIVLKQWLGSNNACHNYWLAIICSGCSGIGVSSNCSIGPIFILMITKKSVKNVQPFSLVCPLFFISLRRHTLQNAAIVCTLLYNVSFIIYVTQ